MSKKGVVPHSSPKNRLPISFDQAIDRLLSIDPKKLPPAVQPATPKAKKKPERKKAKR